MNKMHRHTCMYIAGMTKYIILFLLFLFAFFVLLADQVSKLSISVLICRLMLIT